MVEATAAASKANIEQVLSRIRQISNQGKQVAENHLQQLQPASSFDTLMHSIKHGLSEVSQADLKTESARDAYIKGDTSVPLSEVLVASAKSKVAFEGLVAIRRHFIEAYKEVMNLPV